SHDEDKRLVERRERRRADVALKRARRERALDLWISGCSYREIGKEIGTSQVTARNYVLAIKAERAESADMRRLRLALRYEKGAAIAMQRLRGANAQDTALLLTAIARLGQEEARLLGDYKPTKIA